MSSDESLRRLENSVTTLKETADRLVAHARVALTDKTKVESLLKRKRELDSAVLDCNRRFEDYDDSIT